MAEPFLGEIRLFSFGFPPKGWAMCDGQLLPTGLRLKKLPLVKPRAIRQGKALHEIISIQSCSLS